MNAPTPPDPDTVQADAHRRMADHLREIERDARDYPLINGSLEARSHRILIRLAAELSAASKPGTTDATQAAVLRGLVQAMREAGQTR